MTELIWRYMNEEKIKEAIKLLSEAVEKPAMSEIDWEAEVDSGICFVGCSNASQEDADEIARTLDRSVSLLTDYDPSSEYPFQTLLIAACPSASRFAAIATVRGVVRSWHGGECPVPGDAEVITWMRGEDRRTLGIAGEYSWEHNGGDNDIVKFLWL